MHAGERRSRRRIKGSTECPEGGQDDKVLQESNHIESGEGAENEDPSPNMSSPDQVLALIRSKTKMAAYSHTNIRIIQYVGQKIDVIEKNILLFLDRAHGFVIVTCNGQAWVADGVNNIHARRTLEEEI